MLAPALRDEGDAVRPAADAAQGLAALRLWRPDAIVLDVELPASDGWAFRRAQRAVPGAVAVPVIVVSRRPPPRRAESELIPAAVVPRPFDVDELLATVARLVAPV